VQGAGKACNSSVVARLPFCAARLVREARRQPLSERDKKGFASALRKRRRPRGPALRTGKQYFRLQKKTSPGILVKGRRKLGCPSLRSSLLDHRLGHTCRHLESFLVPPRLGRPIGFFIEELQPLLGLIPSGSYTKSFGNQMKWLIPKALLVDS
jgi:hypothetical protein